jgi:hypothetical protein
MDEIEEVAGTADALRSDIELLFVRGLGSSTPKDRRPIELRAEEWERIGAHHVAKRLRASIVSANAGGRDAPQKLLGAYTSLHTFERVSSLDAANHAWSVHLGERVEPAPRADTGGAKPAPLEDPKGATLVLNDLVNVIEDLVQTGLVSATAATRTKLDVAFKEASRRKLLRLGASLRYVNEEVGRFLADDGTFAARRYSFFLHRSWLLAKGTLLGLSKGDAALVASLTVGVSAAPKPVKSLEVVTLGIAKRATTSACSFDFRLRVIGGELAGQSLVYSIVFARKNDVLPEAYLHLPQPQKFTPKLFRERARVVITDAAVVPGRLMLGPKSTVSVGAAVEDWSTFYTWNPRAAAARVAGHVPSPLDLAVEMQDEIILDDWSLAPNGEEKYPFLVTGQNLSFKALIESREARERLEGVSKKKPRLFGTVHYEGGKMILAPLSFLEDEGPDHIQLSDAKINLTALLGSLNLG